MNTKILMTATLAIALSACGGHKDHINAVDEVSKLETIAKEKAPKAESVKFDDHGQPTMGGVGGAKGANANVANVATATATATTDNTATATATDNTSSDTVKTDTADNTATATADEAKTTADTTKQ